MSPFGLQELREDFAGSSKIFGAHAKKPGSLDANQCIPNKIRYLPLYRINRYSHERILKGKTITSVVIA